MSSVGAETEKPTRPNFLDLDDEIQVDKLAMKLLEKRYKQQVNKRKRRVSSTDDEAAAMDEDDVEDFASVEMLASAKAELMQAVQNINKKFDDVYGKIGGNTQSIEKTNKNIAKCDNNVEALRNELDILRRDNKADIKFLKKEENNTQKKVIREKKSVLTTLKRKT